MALIGKVVAMTGVAFVLTDNGVRRELKLGDQILTGDTIQTPRGVDVDLELVTGRNIHISSEQLVAFTEELTSAIIPSESDSAISLATIDTVINAIESGKDVNEALEEFTKDQYGFGFVDLMRVDDIQHDFKFAYEYKENDSLRTELSAFNEDDDVNTALFALGPVSNSANGGGGISPPSDINTVGFADNFVDGVSYTTSSGLSGLTGDTGVVGQFSYRDGDIITFKVGDVVVAVFNASAIQGNILFLQDIVGTSLADTNTMYLENMAIFLQALDSGLQDSTPIDGTLDTNDLVNLDLTYTRHITITQAVRDAFTGYHLNLADSDKPELSEALAHVGVIFTADSERDPSGNGQNIFETIAIDHVVGAIQELAGSRTPTAFESRQVDQLDIPGGIIKYNFNDANGVITFNAADLLEGATGYQSKVENLVVSNVQLVAGSVPVGTTLVNNGDNTYTITLNAGTTPYNIENLKVDYRVEDWTVFRDVTSGSLDTYKSHLSAVITDVPESAGHTEFTIKSSLAFATDQQLTVKFSPENGLGIAEYSDDFNVPIQYSNDGGLTWQEMQVIGDYTRPDYDKPLPLFAFNLSAGNQEVIIRIAIFDDPFDEAGVSGREVTDANGYSQGVELIDMLVEGDNFYAERLQPGIVDNEPPTTTQPIVEADFAIVNEGDGEAVLTVYLVDANSNRITFTENVTIQYQTQGLSASAGSDYTPISGTVTILAGENSIQIRVPIIDDTLVENLEFLKVNLSNVSPNALLGDPEASIRIYDNDGISIQGQTNLEGNDVVFEVTLNGIDPNALLKLLPTNSGATATLGDDFNQGTLKAYYLDASNNPVTLVLAANTGFNLPTGITQFFVSYQSVDDSNFESNETVRMQVSATLPDGTARFGLGTATIMDNDATPTITVTLTNNFTEDSGTLVGAVVATYTTNDLDGDTVTVTLSDTTNYALDGSGNVTLTAAGLILVNSGADLPAFTLTPNDGTVNGTATNVDPSVTAVNDAPVLSLTAPATPLENAAALGDLISTASATDEENASLVYSLNSNPGNVYAIDANTGAVTLTAAGAALVNAGNDLPAVDVNVTDGVNTVNNSVAVPATSDVNDLPVLSLSTPATPLENAAALGDLISTASATDEENASLVYSLNSNPGNVYAIDANTGAVTLTAAGAALVNAGNDLPAVDVNVTDGVNTVNNSVAVPATSDVNDLPVLSLSTPATPLENAAALGDLISTASATDEENASLVYSLNSNPGNVYAIDANTGAVTLTAAGAALVNAGNDLPAVDVNVTDGVNTVNNSVAVPATSDVNDLPVLSLSTPATPLENAAALGDLISTASATDEENASLVYSLNSNPGNVYAIDANTGAVTLTAAGAALVNAGNDLPAVDVNVTDGVNTVNNSVAVPATSDVNDLPVLSLSTPATPLENAAALGDLISTASATDEENASLVYSLNSNPGNVYAIDANTGAVTLTAAGAALVNAGNDLPAVDVNVTDGVNTVNNSVAVPATSDVNDLPVLSLSTPATPLENAAALGDLISTASATDEENASLVYSLNSNPGNVYAIDANTGAVTLTAAGAALVNAGNDLPAVDVNVTDGVNTVNNSVAVPATSDVNDLPVLSLSTPATPLENAAALGDLISTASATDEENASLVYSLNSNPGNVYAIDANTGAVTLTAAGAALVNAGNDLPAVDVNVTDGVNTVNNSVAVPATSDVNDLPVLSLSTPATPLENAAALGDLISTASATDEENASLVYSLNSNPGNVYAIDANTGAVTLTAAGAALVNAGNDLPAVDVNVTDGVNTVNNSVAVPATSDVNDLPVLSLSTPATPLENAAALGDLISTASATDEENASLVYSLNSNPGNVYAIDANTGAVTLTAAGAALVNAGNDLPAVDVNVTDGVNTVNNSVAVPATSDVNDLPVLSLSTPATPLENAAALGDLISTASATDEENASLVYSLNSNPGNVYAIDANTGAVTLTAAGAALVNAGNDLPAVDVNVTDGVNTVNNSVAVPATSDVNDLPVLSLSTPATPLENAAALGDLISTASATDEENASLVYSLNSNPGNVYAIDANTGAVTLTAAGAALVNAGNDLPAVDVNVTDGVNTVNNSVAVPATSDVNDLPVLSLSTPATPLENAAALGDLISTASATDEENASLVYSLNSNPGNVYAIDANTGAVTLTAAGAALVNAGNDLPAVDVNVTDGVNTVNNSVAVPATSDVNDLPVLSLSTPATPLENAAALGDLISTASATDEENASLVYSLNSNPGNVYAIDANTGAVTLTAAGAALVNAGNDLPAVDVNVTDGVNTVNNSVAVPATSDVNDLPVLSLSTPATPLENAAALGDLISTASATDEENASLVYSLNSNPGNVYAIDANTGAVTLTAAGAALVNAGNDLPAVDVNVTDGVNTVNNSVAVPATSDVNDLPVLSLSTPATPLENAAALGDLISTASATDEENASLVYSLNSNPGNVYAIDANTGAVTLTAAGAALVNAGNDLPAVDVNVTDGVNTVNNSVAVPATSDVNDAPVISGSNTGSVTEDTTLSTGGTLTITDEDAGESAFTPQASAATTYGTFSINAAGVWTYSVNNSDPAVQTLATGQTLSDSITVFSVDGTPATVVITINGADETATIGVGAVQEDVTLTSTGTLTASGVATFVPVTTPSTYGSFSVNAAGAWTYTLNNSSPIVQALAQGENHLESFTVSLSDGSTTSVNVTVSGTNDAAVISGTSTAAITESNAIQNAGGTLTSTDVDGTANLFVAQTGVAGSNGYGSFSINTAGVWTYAMSTAHNEFVGGTNYTDSITVTTADGTSQVITVTMTGTNDAAVISGTSTAAITESNAIQNAGGTLTSTDVDGTANLFVAQTGVAGSNGYGSFSINTAGVWTYAMSTAHNEFVGGTNYTDSITVTTADGTSQVITVTMTGTNDAAVISGTSTAAITESNAIQNAGGTLTSTDVDGTANLFVAQTGVAGSNGYGSFSINTAGVWTYAMSTAHNEFVGGTNYTDSITVTTADGTSQVITVTMTGTNDAAVISGTSTAAITESNAIQNAGGTLTSTDVDGTANLFVAQTGVAGSNGYGSFSINTAGVWTYAMSTAHNEFVGGTNYTDSITVTTADGTSQVITVTMTGTNDAAVISGTSTAAITESNAIQNAGGTLTSTDVDGTANLFVAQTGVAGSNGYGSFSINTAGVWTYAMSTAHNEFVGGTNYTDSITVTTADGTSQVITVTMTGTNDAAVISGTSTAAITESNAIQNAGGTLTSTDVDGTANLFVAQTGVAGSNGYGSFSINTAGVWTYAMSTAHNEFVGGTNYTDSITVTTADGTSQVITVTMTGTNDAAVISGTSTAAITESNAIQNAGGTLTSTDVDGTANLFVAQTGVAGSNGYGSFSINTAGVWTYAMSTAHNEFVGGTNYTDSITVTTADGTSQVITVTMTGTNDAAVISGTSTAAITESNAIQNAGGTLTSTDVDGTANLFVAQTGVAGSNGYGSFSINTAGVWTYAMSTAHNEFVGGTNYTDSITVTTADGTSQVITVTMTGTNDAAVISGTSTAAITESNAIQNAGGTLTSTDVDGTANLFVAQTGVAGSNGYGSFSINTAGVWTYAMSTAHNEFVGGTNYTDSITVTTADGTSQVITVTMTGTNDAAVISGTSTAAITESNAIQNAGGTLTSTDVDGTANLFVAQTGVAGSNGYGSFSINTAGVWTYAMSTAHNEFVGGTNYTDSITVTTADGTSQVITVTMTGTNDAAVISGTSTAAITESNAIQNAGGTLTSTDVDGTANLFVAQTGVAGSNGYGSFSINTAGVWTYAMSTAHNEFVGGTNYTDSITVTTADGTSQVITVTMTGTNDAAVISGTSTAAITESNAIQNAGGTLTSTDVDGTANLFVAQTGVAGSNGYGSFSINTAGVWTYAMSTAHNEFVGGTNYTDSITVTTADGTSQVITVTMTGTNDAAVISGTSTAAITESNAIQNAGGTLTSTDVDGTANLFVAQTGVAGSNGYGSFSINTAGVWTYAMSTAHNEFVGGTNYTDSITVTTADGTSQVITVTMTGTNDAAVISGTSTAAITESNAIQNAGGTLTSTDVDGTANLFVAQTGVAGSNGYGSFSINTAGVWTYAMSTAHNEFVGGTNYTDSITVTTADGTSQVITVTMTGTNDAAVISGTSTAAITESNAIQNAGGTLTSTDVDGTANLFVAQTGVAGSNGYGSFSINTAGVWTYAMSTAHNEFVGGTNYTDSITVTTADGTSQVITVTMTGTNDAAVISGTSTAAITESNAIQNAGGTLTSTDVDGTANLFVAQTGVAGSNGYGSFSINTAGVWTYAMSTAHNEFVGGTNYTDSITVTTADGTSQVITVTMTGTNDAAVISGTSTAAITESNAIQNAGGTLTSTDVDGTANLFVAQTGVAGSNGYGSFSINTAGVWTYAMSTAHNEFVGGTNYTDSITVTTADGTSQVITVTMTGTNDAAVISGTSTAAITESNAIQNAGGTLTSTDVDGTANLFVAQTGVAGSNGYGSFSINTAGVWTYAMSTAHNEFVGGTNYTDSITVTTADGTSQVITVTMTGTNDAAVISGTSTAAITESNAIQNAGGTLTSTDVDGTANLFVAQTGVAGSNGYGSFSINTAGVWTYAMSTAHNEFVGGTNYTDSITVTTADGTSQVITVTMTGTNDAAVISGTSTAAITESNAIQNAGGTLTSTDVDGTANLFVAQTGVAGSNGYGSFSINTAGVWTYAMSTAHNEFVGGTNYTDSITVTTADGTSQVITVTMTGTNDAAVISGTSTAAITESNAIQNAGGTLTSTDVDGTANLFVAQTGVAGSNGYGSFSINTAGVWTYAMSTAHNEFVGGTNYTDSITVTTADGTSQVITVTMTGTNDAAVISGTSTAAITESNAIQNAGGTLTSTDVDGTANLFVAQTGVAGSNGYGSFSINTAGVWTYAMSTAHNEFVGGTNYTDSITVTTADGTSQVITVTMTGTNDAAVISGTSTAAITESNAIQNAGGTLTSTDVDGTANLFVAQTGVAGSNGYGSFSINTAGVWTYAMSTAHNEFVGGTNYTDSITVTTADGTSQVITVTMTGTNDAAVISGTSTAAITESNAIQNAGGTLTSTDVDGTANLFVAQTGVAGSNGYGSFSINTAGVWTYAMSTAHNEFVGGTNYTDSITVTTADGTSQVITVTMTGTNDAAVISGTSTAAITESNAIQNAGGTLTSTDVDGTANLFVAQTGVAGSNGYGSFSINTAGVWTYAMSTAHNEFVGGTNYTDSITVTTADGTSQVITVTMTGTNDAAVISGTSTAAITESNAIQNAGGTLTSTDVDGTANLFVAQTGVAGSNGYGSFSINTAGVWTYAMSTAHNEFVGGTNYTDSITVTTADGTSQVITVTMTGTNDAAVISGTSTAAITESNAIQNAGGTLTSTDVDGTANLFVAQTGVAGSNGYGSFSINTAGVWTYAMSTAHNEFVGGTNYTDSITVTTADGTSQVITVTMTGTNDAAVISGTSTAAITESNAIQNAGGTLTSTDVDGTANLFVAQTGVAGSNGYGSFSINTAGVWTYAMSTAHNEFVGGTNYTDSITVTTADGTSQVITVTMTGTNDAAVISGTSTAAITESNAIQNAGGTLTSTDVDGTANLFVAQTGVAGSNGYGSFSINTAGVWTYAMSTAHNEFVGGTNYTDSITVTTADGTSQVITVTMTGTNDAAVISGTSTAAITESNAIQNAGGTLTSTDVDGTANLFVAQTGVAGSNGYGSFSINTAGVWTYAMSTAHNEFVGGTNYTDSITVTTADGTSQVITVTMTGTNDAAVISGTSTAAITESNAIQNAGGTLTSTDVDGTANLFVAQTGVAGSNGYGSFSINTAGVWTYAMSTAHNEFVGGTNYTDSITVTTADGTSQVITVTMTGTNDAAVISGTSTGAVTEASGVANAVPGTPTATGILTSTDVDNPANSFTAVGSATASTNGYGTYTMTAGGVWTYILNNNNATVQALNAAGTLADSFTVASVDGTTRVINVTINGANDAAVITGTSTANITESNAIQNAGGTLTATDVDSAATFVAQTNVNGSNGYGKFTINAAGVWTYAMNTAHDEFVAGTNYTDSITVATSDGTTRVITVTISGTDDAAVISGTSLGSVTEAGGVANAIPGTPTATGTLTNTDVDNPANTFTASSGTTSYGSYTMTVGGVWTYTLNNNNATVQALNAAGTLADSFTVASAGGTTRVINITINGANDAPTVVADTLTILEDASASTGNVLTNDSDPEGSALSVTQFVFNGTTYAAGATATVPNLGSLSIAANGDYTFTPAANYGGGVPAATYTVSDGTLTTTSTLKIYVTPGADAPILTVPSTITSTSHSGATTITNATAVSQANLEASLGLASGQLDSTFDPPGTDPGFVDVFNGDVTEFGRFLTAGSQLSFNWNFYNGEDTQSEINQGYNDVVALVVTDSAGNRQYIQVSSSEQTGPNTNGATVDATGTYTYTAAASTGYTFSWLILNARDGTKLSTLDVAAPVLVSGTTYGAPIAITISAQLADKDGSETLGAVTISGVPAGAIFSAGTNLGGGVWSFTTAQLSGLKLFPAVGFVGTLNLTVSVSSTDALNGAVATTTQALVVNIDTTTATTTGTAANNTLTGTAANDLVQGLDGNDSITGGSGNDILYGDAGADTLTGGIGNDVLTGGAGTDRFNVDSGTDTITDLSGSDVLVVSAGATANATVSEAFTATATTSNSGVANLTTSGANVTLTAATGTAGYSVTNTGAANTIVGSGFNDTITGGTGNDSLSGGAGADILTGGLGNDTMTGGAGNDTFNVNAGKDNITDLSGSDVLAVSAGATANATVSAAFTATAATSNTGAATLTSNAFAVNLGAATGNAGYTIINSGGATSLTGSTFNDTIRGGTGNDTLAGGAGLDLLDFSPAGAFSFTLAASGSGTAAVRGNDTYTNFEGVIGGTGNDTITGNTGDNVLIGGGGADSLSGGSGNDTIQGGAGNDTLDGGAGGNDLLDFSEVGTGFAFTLAAGGGGTATVNGTDTYTNFEGVVGGAGNDTITGNTGDNILRGGGGNDSLSGAAGADTLIGGAGNDTMTGGGVGVDVFKWELSDKGTVGSPATDVVTDFDTASQTLGGDVLDLRDLLTGETTGNLTSFLYFEKSGVDTIVHISTNGAITGTDTLAQVNSKNDQTITLQNVDLVTPFGGDQTNIIADMLSKQKLITD